jgi:hypothetical protein
VSPETCWAIKKHWNNNFYYTDASCWFFLWVLYYDARIRGHQVQKLKICWTQKFNFFLSPHLKRCLDRASQDDITSPTSPTSHPFLPQITKVLQETV